MNKSSTLKPAYQVVTAINAAIAALDAHDAWHADHDDHDGYPESDLQDQTAAARAALLVAISLVGRLIPQAPEGVDQPALHCLIDAIGDALEACGATATAGHLAHALITIMVTAVEQQGLDANGAIDLKGPERTMTIHPKTSVPPTAPSPQVMDDLQTPLESDYQ